MRLRRLIGESTPRPTALALIPCTSRPPAPEAATLATISAPTSLRTTRSPCKLRNTANHALPVIDFLPHQRMALHVHVLLKVSPLLQEFRAGGATVWVDGDEEGISALLVVPSGLITDARLEGGRALVGAGRARTRPRERRAARGDSGGRVGAAGGVTEPTLAAHLAETQQGKMARAVLPELRTHPLMAPLREAARPQVDGPVVGCHTAIWASYGFRGRGEYQLEARIEVPQWWEPEMRTFETHEEGAGAVPGVRAEAAMGGAATSDHGGGRRRESAAGREASKLNGAVDETVRSRSGMDG